MKKKVALILVFVLVLSVASLAFAAEGDVVNIADTMKTSFQTVANDTIQMMSGVAPVALTIFGAMLCWKFGKKFFKKMTD